MTDAGRSPSFHVCSFTTHADVRLIAGGKVYGNNILGSATRVSSSGQAGVLAVGLALLFGALALLPICQVAVHSFEAGRQIAVVSENAILTPHYVGLDAKDHDLKTNQYCRNLCRAASQYPIVGLLLSFAFIIGGVFWSFLGWRHFDDKRRLRGATFVAAGWGLSWTGLLVYLWCL